MKKFEIRKDRIEYEGNDCILFRSFKGDSGENFMIKKSDIVERISFSRPDYSNDRKIMEWEFLSVNDNSISKRIDFLFSEMERLQMVKRINEYFFGIDWHLVAELSKESYDKNRCFYCERTILEKMTDDHLISKHLMRVFGFKNGIGGNLVNCCRFCNSDKGSMHPQQWMEKVIKSKKNPNKEYPIENTIIKNIKRILASEFSNKKKK